MVADIVLLAIPFTWQDVLDAIVTVFELIAALIIFYGSARVVVEILASGIHRQPPAYSAIRREYTKKISLALEFFVANDLVRTILEPTLNQIIVLAVIVGIRTVVGWSLSRELKELSAEERSVQQEGAVGSQ
ncbi:MAG: DUF1622 domain-containing protein [Halobacteriota archaeon]